MSGLRVWYGCAVASTVPVGPISRTLLSTNDANAITFAVAEACSLAVVRSPMRITSCLPVVLLRPVMPRIELHVMIETCIERSANAL